MQAGTPALESNIEGVLKGEAFLLTVGAFFVYSRAFLLTVCVGAY